MIGYIIPHSVYSKGYHCKLEFTVALSKYFLTKKFAALYHMGIYTDKDLLK